MKAIQGTNAKLIVIGVLIILILIPMGMIRSLIAERQDRKAEAVSDVTSKWGEKQVITGPIITVPYRVNATNENNEVVEIIRFKHFLPESLHINGAMKTEIRERGIYEVVLYNSEVILEGRFPKSLMARFEAPEQNIMIENAVLSLGISDMGGIQKPIAAAFNDQAMDIEPGLTTRDIISSGVHSPKIEISNMNENTFKFEIDINGSESLHFTPLGKENTVALISDWKYPSFSGAFLPRHRTLSGEGFAADWTVLNLNRNYPQTWDGSEHQTGDSAFGVNLYIASDLYKKSTRAIKYALLFVVFTFAIFFCAEMINGNKIHPFQYLLVGLAISVFYILLVSISEHANFDIAYLISSAATVLLIGAYARAMFGQNRLPFIIMGTLTVLYGYLYALMQLEDFALLAGGIGLFTGLSVIMYITRKINWYAVPEDSANTEK